MLLQIIEALKELLFTRLYVLIFTILETAKNRMYTILQ